MIILQAKFIGKDSLGFKSGLTYNLRLHTQAYPMVNISTNGGTFPDYNRLNCDYSSVGRFIDNWEVVKINLFEPKNSEEIKNELFSKLSSNMRDTKINKLINA